MVGLEGVEPPTDGLGSTVMQMDDSIDITPMTERRLLSVNAYMSKYHPSDR
jgi:hypothetical protein